MGEIAVPSIHDEVIKAFKALDCHKLDLLHRSVEVVYKDLFQRLINKDIDGFYYESEPGTRSYNMYIYTRSVKNDGVQRSVIWCKDGEYIPLSDCQFQVFEDLRTDGCADGVIIHWYNLEKQ